MPGRAIALVVVAVLLAFALLSCVLALQLTAGQSEFGRDRCNEELILARKIERKESG